MCSKDQITEVSLTMKIESEFLSMDREQLYIMDNINCKLAIEERHINQIVRDGSSLDKAEIINNGIDVRLNLQEKQGVFNLVKDIIGDDCLGPIQLQSQNKFELKGHVLRKTKNELTLRGFDSEPEKLYPQIAEVIFSIEKVEKAKIHFDIKCQSKPTLTYTIKSRKGRIAISFQPIIDFDYSTDDLIERDIIIVVTVLKRFKR